MSSRTGYGKPLGKMTPAQRRRALKRVFQGKAELRADDTVHPAREKGRKRRWSRSGT